MDRMDGLKVNTRSNNILYKLLSIAYRLMYLLLVPVFMIYMMLPPLWIIGIPYWIITGRNLMKDWCGIYGI